MALKNCVKECCSQLASTHSQAVTDVEIQCQESKKSVVKQITGSTCCPEIKQALLFLTEPNLPSVGLSRSDSRDLSILEKKQFSFLCLCIKGERGWKGGMQNCFKHFDCFSKKPYKLLSLQRKMLT